MSDRIRKAIADIRTNYPDQPYPGDLRSVAKKLLDVIIEEKEIEAELHKAVYERCYPGVPTAKPEDYLPAEASAAFTIWKYLEKEIVSLKEARTSITNSTEVKGCSCSIAVGKFCRACDCIKNVTNSTHE